MKAIILTLAIITPAQASDWTGSDKVLHAKYGAGIGAVTVMASNFAQVKNPVLTGALAATLAGIGKEAYDYIDYGVFDPKDAIVTAVSGIASAWLTNKFMNLESMPVSVEFAPVDDGFYFGIRGSL